MMWTKLKNNWELLLLIAVQAYVLFYDFGGIPFYHDELSAIERCKVSTFTDLIEKGVMVDGHPAGVHLFLFSLIKLFGIHEWILKLPFLLAGIGSLFFLYKTSEFIFNKYAAFTTCVFFIFLSYYIAQFIVARPYSSGLFFSLGAFYHGLKIKLFPYNKYPYVMLSLFSTIAMYSHYFSFLQCLTIWTLIFIFYSKWIYNRYYLIAVSISILLFLPHLPITINQLQMGGLGWLGKPEIGFFKDFFYTYFNSSIPMICLASALFIFSIMVKKNKMKVKVILLLLFLTPSFVLFTYSLAIAPVLQFSALFFCSPYLLIFIGNGINFFSDKIKIILLTVLLIFNGFVLIIQNQYYQLRNYQPIEKFVITSTKLSEIQTNSKTLYLWQGNSKYINYFLQKYSFHNRFISTDTLQNINKINLINYDLVACNQLSPSILYEVSKSFPFVESVDNNLLYTFMVLTKHKTPVSLYSPPIKLIFNFDSGKEWSQSSYSFKLNQLIADKYRFIEFVPMIDSVMKGAELVLETYEGTERIDWRSIYLEPNNLLSIKLKDVIQEITPNHSIKIFIWNSAKIESKPIEIKMLQRADNPWEYQFKIN